MPRKKSGNGKVVNPFKQQGQQQQQEMVLFGIHPSLQSRIIKALRKLPYEEVEELLGELTSAPQISVTNKQQQRAPSRSDQPMA